MRVQRVVAFVFTLVLSTAIACAPIPIARHSGGTDSSGCHTNSRTGDYHCHNGGAGGELSGGALAGLLLGSLVVLTAALVYLYVVSAPPAPRAAPAPPPPKPKAPSLPKRRTSEARTGCWSRCPELGENLKWQCRRRCEASEKAGYRWFCAKKCEGQEPCIELCLEDS